MHRPPARYFQDDAIDFFKRLLEFCDTGTLAVGDAAIGFLRFFFSAHPLPYMPLGPAQAADPQAHRRVAASPCPRVAAVVGLRYQA